MEAFREIRAHAKINLGLKILGRREDVPPHRLPGALGVESDDLAHHRSCAEVLEHRGRSEPPRHGRHGHAGTGMGRAAGEVEPGQTTARTWALKAGEHAVVGTAIERTAAAGKALRKSEGVGGHAGLRVECQCQAATGKYRKRALAQFPQRRRVAAVAERTRIRSPSAMPSARASSGCISHRFSCSRFCTFGSSVSQEFIKCSFRAPVITNGNAPSGVSRFRSCDRSRSNTYARRSRISSPDGPSKPHADGAGATNSLAGDLLRECRC